MSRLDKHCFLIPRENRQSVMDQPGPIFLQDFPCQPGFQLKKRIRQIRLIQQQLMARPRWIPPNASHQIQSRLDVGNNGMRVVKNRYLRAVLFMYRIVHTFLPPFRYITLSEKSVPVFSYVWSG
ncbi:hypothetical protein BGX30_001782 [Mortierella sp. GBA39]|nr:hypothetical protein BGX30_001782 [Mortierella sp. GBA39]